ncbi:MAG: putative DNA modification/repair radical SAM protein [Firmicutes bacterium]|nr:putative DNA modification/repair radical SAM protein [Bacillota bacterium]
MDLLEKLRILAGAAKYDVSCASSGSSRGPQKGALGSVTGAGCCHTFTADGRCVSLLKILLTNHCIYDCAYCANRKSNDVERAAFTADEVVGLTINFYRRNYIDGLFISSAVSRSPDHTMELMIRVVEKLRNEQKFRGYIHLKVIPGADSDLVKKAGALVDRMSVNIELPSSRSLKLLAPEKKQEDIFQPMGLLRSGIAASRAERRESRKAPLFVPAGQSTQLIVGASDESDYHILHLSEGLYRKYSLKRVYYSAYVPVNRGKNLPTIENPPTLREHRLYQGDWLLRFYGFEARELLSEANPNFDVNFDPKTNWALNNLDSFPLEVNRAPYEMLLRVPGIGVRGANKIISARRVGRLGFDDLKKLGIVIKRARYFITCQGRYYGGVDLDPLKVRRALQPGLDLNLVEQLSLFAGDESRPLLPPAEAAALGPGRRLLLPDAGTEITGEF